MIIYLYSKPKKAKQSIAYLFYKSENVGKLDKNLFNDIFSCYPLLKLSTATPKSFKSIGLRKNVELTIDFVLGS